jgi:hypothetical protein
MQSAMPMVGTLRWARGACHRARVRATRWLCPPYALTRLRILAARCVRGLRLDHPHRTRGRREGRVSADTHGPRATKSTRQNHRFSRNNRPSLRNGFNGLLRALPGEPGFLATVTRMMRSIIANLAPASGRQDHTALPSAITPVVCCRNCVHRIPALRFVTTRTPLSSGGTPDSINLFLPNREAIYFLRGGWTGFRSEGPSRKSVGLYALLLL